ncbi:hypothetical protein [Sinorhizobium meliloti]|uniref:hypothetical protein n=1 Tax=Rhizobium meliloti TaxID=382 RepID=UPI0003DC81D6|nr:hypothetical protein [Sinorhizobium meliloti]ARS72851.1 hypothetical protein SMRU11_28975 [Sinorhizobium meliloti RU11/001]
MTPIILLAVGLSGAMCVLAFALATHAVPFILGLAAFRLAFAWGAGWMVAGTAGVAAAILSFALFVYLWEVLRSPSAKLVLAIVYAAPAAVVGYAFVHGVIGAAPLSEPGRQFLCLASGGFVGLSAVGRLATP